jgi:antitoxin VapB
MTLHIKNNETDRLARRLAALKQVSLTRAVHIALENELTREQASIPLVDRVAEFRAKVLARARPEMGQPADKAFYDDLSGDS